MTAYTTYTNGKTIAATSGGNAAGFPAHDVIQGVYDAALRNTTAADTIAVLSIPANTYVSHVFYKVLTADASQTMSVGDGDGTSSWISGADVGTEGNAGCSSVALTDGTHETITGYSGGKFYSAADTIDILVPSNKAYDTLKVLLCAAVVRFG